MKNVLLFLIGLSLTGCDHDSNVILKSSDIAQVIMTPGFQQNKVTILRGGEILYGLWIPPNINTGQSVPLVVALHGRGSNTPYIGDALMRTLVQPALQDLGSIIIAPDVPGDSWFDITSEQTVMQFITIASDEWPVDPNRIYITGYSMGGIGTWFLADKYPDTFCGAIPIASTPIGYLSGKVPHYVIQGEYDEEFGTSPVRHAVEVIQSKHRKARLVIADSLGHGDINGYIPYLRDCITWFNDTALTR
jgi:predicted peptidase